MADEKSKVEVMKEASRQLRGTIALDLVGEADHFNEQDKTLLKFHGTYQQEDRDARKNRSKAGVGKHHMFMVRCKIPAGIVTADQYLALDDITTKYASGTLRLTSRQGLQFHSVLKPNLKNTIAEINQCLLTTLGACGDVERNVMACPAPLHDGLRPVLQRTAAELAAHLAPRTKAYHEIWLNGERVTEPSANGSSKRGPEDEEPLYGKTYLPRKFKTGLALPGDNCIDVYAQDLGLLANVENGRIVGYNVLVGGGMGLSHGNSATFVYLGRPICYIDAAGVIKTAEAVIKLFRDHGNRTDRKRNRIKYLVHDWGVEKFRDVLTGYVGRPLTLPRPIEVTDLHTHHGWNAQGDGRWWYGISVENGRIKDEGDFRLRTALRILVQKLRPAIRFTPMQDILLCDLPEHARGEIESVLMQHGVPLPGQVSVLQRYALSCPAVPTCGLAISESERALPGIIDELEAELRRLGLDKEALSVRMTGCPNGCARPYQSDIGLVGRSGDKYVIYLGGHVLGHRLNFPFLDLVPRGDIVPALVPVLEHFKSERLGDELFGDYCVRKGVEQLRAFVPEGIGKAPAEH
jgi:sulfite reductase (ferredoxin)